MKHFYILQHGWAQNYSAKVKEASQKKHILYDSIYRKYSESTE